MKINIAHALEDVSYIKGIINRTKMQVSSLSTLFIFSGFSYLFIFVSSLATSLLIKSEDDLNMTDIPYILVSTIVIVLLTLLFFKKRPAVKNSNTVYSLPLYDLWGVIIILLPLAWRVFISVFGIIWPYLMYEPALESDDLRLYTVYAIYFVIVCVSLFFMGIIFNNRIMKYCSIILMVAYVCTYLLPLRIEVNTVLLSNNKTTPLYRSPQLLYSSLMQPLIYIVLGFYFKRMSSGDNNGNT